MYEVSKRVNSYPSASQPSPFSPTGPLTEAQGKRCARTLIDAFNKDSMWNLPSH